MNVTATFIANVIVNKHLHQGCSIIYSATHHISVLFHNCEYCNSLPIQSHSLLYNRLLLHRTFNLIIYKKDLFFRVQKRCTCYLFFTFVVNLIITVTAFNTVLRNISLCLADNLRVHLFIKHCLGKLMYTVTCSL